MGTRSLTVFVDRFEHEGKMHEKEIVVMYRQMDGYPTGHGKDLLEFLKPYQLVNGISRTPPELKIANGMQCLAAQVICHFKMGTDESGKYTQPQIGNIYLHEAGTRDAGEEYIYFLSPHDKSGTGDIHLKVIIGDVTYFGLPGTKESDMPAIYDGTLSKFDPEKAEKKAKRLMAKGIKNNFLESQKQKALPPIK